MDCPPRVNISHYTHHNFRSGSAFRRVITSCLLSRGSDTHPYFPPVASYLFQRTLSPGAECTCLNHLVRFAFGAHSYDFFFTRAFQCVHQRESFFSLPSLSNLGNREALSVAFGFLLGSISSLKLFAVRHFSSRSISLFNKFNKVILWDLSL